MHFTHNLIGFARGTIRMLIQGQVNLHISAFSLKTSPSKEIVRYPTVTIIDNLVDKAQWPMIMPDVITYQLCTEQGKTANPSNRVSREHILYEGWGIKLTSQGFLFTDQPAKAETTKFLCNDTGHYLYFGTRCDYWPTVEMVVNENYTVAFPLIYGQVKIHVTP